MSSIYISLQFKGSSHTDANGSFQSYLYCPIEGRAMITSVQPLLVIHSRSWPLLPERVTRIARNLTAFHSASPGSCDWKMINRRRLSPIDLVFPCLSFTSSIHGFRDNDAVFVIVTSFYSPQYAMPKLCLDSSLIVWENWV